MRPPQWLEMQRRAFRRHVELHQEALLVIPGIRMTRSFAVGTRLSVTRRDRFVFVKSLLVPHAGTRHHCPHWETAWPWTTSRRHLLLGSDQLDPVLTVLRRDDAERSHSHNASF